MIAGKIRSATLLGVCFLGTTALIYGVSFAEAPGATTQPVKGSASASSPGKKTAFFDGGAGKDDDVFSHLREMPKDAVLDSSNYKRVVITIVYFAKVVLSPEWRPDDKFLTDHVKLFRATAARRFDAAYISYQVGETSVMIVQTGGPEARTTVFIANNDISPPDTADTTAFSMATTLKKYVLLVPTPKELAASFGHPCMAKFIEPKTVITKDYTGFRAIIDKQELAVSYLDAALTLPARPAAREPEADKWFDWEKEIQDNVERYAR